MNKKIGKTLLLSLLAGSIALSGAACSKKTLIPPETTAGSGTDMNYPAADRYNENALPAEGSLDDARRKGGMGSGMNQSDEYKRVHGRCSEGFSPVYFDYDQASIRPDMRSRMEANAAQLKKNANAHVIIEGNSDERGTNEYNLALGERRAQNAKDYLISLGIQSGRIRTVSYGEERPLFEGQNEDAYAQNRRDDFIAE